METDVHDDTKSTDMLSLEFISLNDAKIQSELDQCNSDQLGFSVMSGFDLAPNQQQSLDELDKHILSKMTATVKVCDLFKKLDSIDDFYQFGRVYVNNLEDYQSNLQFRNGFEI